MPMIEVDNQKPQFYNQILILDIHFTSKQKATSRIPLIERLGEYIPTS